MHQAAALCRRSNRFPGCDVIIIVTKISGKVLQRGTTGAPPRSCQHPAHCPLNCSISCRSVHHVKLNASRPGISPKPSQWPLSRSLSWRSLYHPDKKDDETKMMTMKGAFFGDMARSALAKCKGTWEANLLKHSSYLVALVRNIEQGTHTKG